MTKAVRMHLAAKFVENEVRELLNTYELTPMERTILTRVARQIISSFIEYNHIVCNHTYEAMQDKHLK